MSWEPVIHCRICGDAFDVYRGPDERVCEACREDATQIAVTIEDQQLSPKQQERAEHLRRAMKRMGHAQ